MVQHKIAIIGAGPAGCMLARLLHQRDIPVTIFEGESSPDLRSQGGTLDLHQTTGLAAVKQAGLYDEFIKRARYDGEAMDFCDKKLLSYVKKSGGKEGDRYGRPEIDRPVLRRMLFESLPKGMIKWGHRLRRIDEDLRLHFDQGVESGYDLIVGADGAWSKVRSLLTDETPFYSGISGLSLTISDAERREPELYRLVNRGSLFSSSDGKSIMAQYMGSGEISVSSWAVQSEHWLEENKLDAQNARACKAVLREHHADWDPRLVDLTQKADDLIVPRNFYMLPVGNRWKNRPGVTLVGDAAHLMTPFAGEGVNLAFEDTMKLAHAIIRASQKGPEAHKDALHAEVRQFEEDMFKRAKKTQQHTWNNLELLFLTPGAPRSTIERFIISAASDEIGTLLTPVLAVAVYIYFFFFKLIY
ncbi:tetracycline resistance protein from transposon [Viridothelium virens]|uniref:Tetracycline resistance protein from transposon n=1 Tax=Viridothelium virens TaxID=1048519 RepID=A0A6A6H6M1_VIRVR|nr:tetracycline resistance protein from transposon [Viridothelium virens]